MHYNLIVMLRAYRAAFPDTKYDYVDYTGAPLDPQRVYRARDGGLYWRSGFLGIERPAGSGPWLMRNLIWPLTWDMRRGGRWRQPWWFWRAVWVLHTPGRGRTRRGEFRTIASDVGREIRRWWRRQPPILRGAKA